MRLVRRLLKIIAVGVLVVIGAGAVLVYGFGMHFEMTARACGRLSASTRPSRITHDSRRSAPPNAPRPPHPRPRPSRQRPVLSSDGRRLPSPIAVPPSTASDDPAARAHPHRPRWQSRPRRPVDASGGVKTSWTGFRGPRRDGIYRERSPVRTRWDRSHRHGCCGSSRSARGTRRSPSPTGRAFTIEQRRDKEVVAAYDVDTGRELWTHEWTARFGDSTGDGPRATPTWHDGRVYALGALGELRALDAATGRLAWRHNILEENGADNTQWAVSASPLVVDGKVVVLPGGTDRNSVVAYEAATGAKVWSVLDDPQAYTAPMVATLAGRRQIVVVSARRVLGLTIDDGTILWEFPWVTDYGVNAAQPIVVAQNRLFVSAAYGHGAVVIELAVDGDRLSPTAIWQNTRMKNKFSSSVFYDGHVYGLDEAILACVDAATGELKWKGGRYGYGQMMLAGGHVVVVTERGEIALVKATPESHQEVAILPAIDGKTWNHPAMADGRLLVRNGREMAAFDFRP